MFKKIALSGVGILLLASPVYASADTLSDLQAQVQALLAQIAMLKIQMGTGAPGPSVPQCVALTKSLSLDDTDAENNGEVSVLQRFLAQDASIYPEGRITGFFGPATERAVQRWQRAHNIVSSGDPDSTGYGYIGARTRAAIAAQCLPTLTPPRPPTPSTSCGNGDDYYDGGEDTDTVIYSGKRSEYFITQNANGTFTFRDTVPCRAETDTVVNMELFRFDDGLYTLQTLRPDLIVPQQPTTPSALPHITLLSPNGGELLTLDQSVTVRWSASNVPQGGYYVVQFERQDGDKRQISVVATTNASVSYVTFPTLRTVNTQLPVVAGTYKVSVWIAGVMENQSARDSSDGVFQVVDGILPNATPSCTMSYKTTRGTHTFTSTTQSPSSEHIMIWKDEPLTISWNSTNAMQAYDYSGNSISTSGSVTIQPPQLNRTYQYQFNSPSGIVNCSAVVYPITASIDQSALNSSSATPTLTGSASGVQSVEVVVRKDVFNTVRLYDIVVPVINGRWTTIVTSPLTTGTYNIDIYGPTDQKLNYMVSGTLAVNTNTAGTPAAYCTLSASVQSASVNQAFFVSWGSSNIAQVAPTFAVGPSMYVTTPSSGTSGTILNGTHGSQQYYSSAAGTMIFQAGTGGIAGGAFVPLCTLSIPIVNSLTTQSSTNITVSSLYPRANFPFVVSGTTLLPQGSTLKVALVAGNYTGSRDWLTISSYSGATIQNAPVSGGVWATPWFNGAPEGTTYTVIVYDPSNNYGIVATGFISISDKG